MLSEKIKEIDKETDGEIFEAIKDKRFKPLTKNGVWIGFFTWQEKWQEGKRHVFIRNMYISPEYRSRENLLFLRNFFRNLYKRDYRFVFWHSKKHDRYFYAR